jgi:aminoglycoside 2'-N-acetyltransferase I
VEVRTAHTARVPAEVLAQGRALMALAFNSYSDDDWTHALGGEHAYVVEDGRLVAHGSVVQRHCYHGHDAARVLRVGYVESVAVHPDRQRQGLGHAVMAALEELAPAYDLLALSSSSRGRVLYNARGWVPWRGTLHVLGPDGPVHLPDEEGGVLVLGADALDLDAPLACDWRECDVW